MHFYEKNGVQDRIIRLSLLYMKAIAYTMLVVGAGVTLGNLPKNHTPHTTQPGEQILYTISAVKASVEEAWPAQYSVVSAVPCKIARLVTPSVDASWETMVERVKSWEGFRSAPYLCPAKVLTIGYGHTGERVHGGNISEKEAEELLRIELRKTKSVVLKTVKVPLSPSQVAALTSFTYNCGPGALRALVNKPGRLNDGNYTAVSKVLPLYRKGGG